MIRPVEMQMLLPRTESVGNTPQHENQRVVNENTFAANEVAKEVKHNSETVIRKDGNQLAEFQYDAREEGNGTYKKPKKRKRQQKQSDDEPEKNESSDERMGSDKQPRINIQI
ncbi:MAG: hypothetical protein K2L07_13900 [Lachnospiraceae bacterium]|nr:hypothetical protein [Lachnospiraceae bacterium]